MDPFSPSVKSKKVTPLTFSVDKSRLTNSNSRNLTLGLFFETSLRGETPEGRSCVYTLKDKDHTVDGITYPSLYRLYMEEEDLTEYNFANKYLNGWSHWLEISNATWFKEYAKRWREELYLKISARALNQIKALSKTTSRDAFAAQRYLIEKGWLPKDEKSRGRPTKEQVQQEAKRQAQDQTFLKEDFARLVSITPHNKGQLN